MQVFALKFWRSQSLNRGNMVNTVKVTSLHTFIDKPIVKFVILLAVRIVFEKIVSGKTQLSLSKLSA